MTLKPPDPGSAGVTSSWYGRVVSLEAGVPLNVNSYIAASDTDDTNGFIALAAAMAATGRPGYVPGRFDSNGDAEPYVVQSTFATEKVVLQDGFHLFGDGPEASVIQVADVGTGQGEHRVLKVATGASGTLRDLTILGQTSVMPTNQTQPTATSVGGLSGDSGDVLCENVHFRRLTWGTHLSGTLTCRSCVFDGEINGGINKDAMAILHPESSGSDGGTVILDGCTFRNNGATNTYMVGFFHDIYVEGNTNLILHGCVFEPHTDGRNITMHGSGADANGVKPIVSITGCSFAENVTSTGTPHPHFLGSLIVAPARCSFTDCLFNGKSAMQLAAGATISGCTFNRTGTTTGIANNSTVLSGRHRLDVTDCVFKGTSTGQDIYVGNVGAWDVTVSRCTFTGTRSGSQISVQGDGYTSTYHVTHNQFGEADTAGQGALASALRFTGGYSVHVAHNDFYQACDSIKVAGGGGAGQQVVYMALLFNNFSNTTGSSYSVVSNGPTNRYSFANFGSVAHADTVLPQTPIVTSMSLGSSTAGGTQFLQGFEQTADPSAPAANGFRLFAKDNGSGKTQLAVRFPTGATQVIATEP